MGLIHGNVSIVNLDGTLLPQEMLIKESNSVFHLRNFCPLGMLSPIEQFNKAGDALTSLPEGIIFLGSGDYHHLSFHLIKRIKKPVTVYLFDNHSDDLEAPPGFVTCGSWVREMLKIPNIEKIIIIGLSSKKTAGSKIDGHGKILKIDFTAQEQIEYSEKLERYLKWALDNTQTEDIYISIDKDVLKYGQAYTNWDQGQMQINQLLKAITILSEKNILGVDVCGEWKTAKDFSLMTVMEYRHILTNQKTNLAILETLRINANGDKV